MSLCLFVLRLCVFVCVCVLFVCLFVCLVCVICGVWVFWEGALSQVFQSVYHVNMMYNTHEE